MVTGRGVRVPVPERSRRRLERGLGVYAGETTTSVDTHSFVGAWHGRYAVHDRVRGAASRNMDGTTMDIRMEYMGWKSATVSCSYVGVTARAAATGDE